MSDHLPECNRSHPPEGYYYTADDCICNALRQAEQRVLSEQELGLPRLRMYEKGCKVGYAAGVQAARQAVDAAHVLDHTDGPERAFVVRVDVALAAIDALRGTDG